MANFVRQKSDIAMALDRLQGFADNLISMETNRRIQLGREKESRMVDAYAYMLGEEELQIDSLELALDTIEQNFLDRGIELKSVKEEYRSINSEELLSAANEGAMELVNAKLISSQDYKTRLENKVREANKIKRHIDLFDDAINIVDPNATGEKGIVEASDVADAAVKFLDAHDKYAPEIEQRLQELQTEGELERLQGDYYTRLARESQEKITASTAETTDATIKIKMLEDVKKETLEGVKAMTYQPISSMVEQYRSAITIQGEIASGKDAITGEVLKPREVAAKEILKGQEYTRLGVIFAPWAFSKEQAALEAQNLQTSLTKAGNGNYQEIINYLKKGHNQYILWTQEGNQMAEVYRSDIQEMLGIDVANQEWVGQLEELWWSVSQADIEQATEALKAGRQFLPEMPDDRNDALQNFMEEGW